MESFTLQQTIDRAMKMGVMAADSKNDGDPYSPEQISNALAENLDRMPPLVQQAAITAYTTAYVHIRLNRNQ